MKNSSYFPVPVAPVATLDNLSNLYQIIENSPARSAWSRGVRSYALDIIEDITNFVKFNLANGYELPLISEDCALNGADDWTHYACGGCGAALIYSDDIAARLCTPSELRIYQKRGGDTIEWQGRALFQAWRLISQNLGKLS